MRCCCPGAASLLPWPRNLSYNYDLRDHDGPRKNSDGSPSTSMPEVLRRRLLSDPGEEEDLRLPLTSLCRGSQVSVADLDREAAASPVVFFFLIKTLQGAGEKGRGIGSRYRISRQPYPKLLAAVLPSSGQSLEEAVATCIAVCRQTCRQFAATSRLACRARPIGLPAPRKLCKGKAIFKKGFT